MMIASLKIFPISDQPSNFLSFLDSVKEPNRFSFYILN